jgi:hypothetical protein
VSAQAREEAASNGVLHGPNIRPITSTKLLTPRVRSTFDRSIDCSRVFVSNLLVARRWACTVGIDSATPHDTPQRDHSETCQLMNPGPHPAEDTVVHEMAHVWQYQHCPYPALIVNNCLTCRYFAVRKNLSEVTNDPRIVFHPDFPHDYPYSAFAYIPGAGLKCTAEQHAQDVQTGDDSVIGIIQASRIGTIFPPVFNSVMVGDRRQPLYKI